MNTNPAPQRALRGHMPARPTSRAATTAEHHARLAARLTPRDRWLAHLCLEHRVFTTHQIVQLAFPTQRAANLRLRQLFCWRFLDRFQPFLTVGTAPMHYVLDIAGAHALAHAHDLEPRALGYRHASAIGIAHSLQLAHTVGTNGFFTPLVAASRHPAAPGRLITWWSEARCARHFGDVVRPDAYALWREHDAEIEFFLEFDFGTEAHTVLANKLAGYEKLAAVSGITTPVLLWFPTVKREAHARLVLTDALTHLRKPALVPIATGSADYNSTGGDSTPAGRRWLPLTGHRYQASPLRLAELAGCWPSISPPQSPAASPATSAEPATGVLPPPSPLPPVLPAYSIGR